MCAHAFDQLDAAAHAGGAPVGANVGGLQQAVLLLVRARGDQLEELLAIERVNVQLGRALARLGRELAVGGEGAMRQGLRLQAAGEGVDVDEGIDAQMLALSEALYEKVEATPSDSEGAALAELWAAAVEASGLRSRRRKS